MENNGVEASVIMENPSNLSKPKHSPNCAFIPEHLTDQKQNLVTFPIY